MARFHVVAIPTKVAELVRSSMKAPGYGHPAHAEVATGHGPCRHCLQTFTVGVERRILFTYDPFHELSCEPLPGPIFVHADACARYNPSAGYPDPLRAHPVTLQAYGEGRNLLLEKSVLDGQVEALIEQMLADSQVAFIHVRDREAGCYDFRIVRQQLDPACRE